MPRPMKFRHVCCLPKYNEFMPAGYDKDIEPVVLAVDEYETIRLIDKEGLSQEECSEYMKVARTTVQQIYTDARGKIATSLVEGRPLFIRGGNYCLCDENNRGCNGCHRHRGCMMDKEDKK